MAYRGVGVQHRRDLGGLDAESADLDLRVGAAEELQRAVRPASHHIAGPVHPLARHERVGDEPARRLAGPAEIAASQLVAGQVELAGYAVGRGSQPRIEHVRASGHRGPPDGGFLVFGDLRDDGLDGGFCWAVTVVGRHASAGAFVADQVPRRDADGLATERQHAERHRGQQSDGVQLSEHRRRGVDQVDAVPRDRLDQRLGVTLDVVVDDVHRMPVEQGDQRLPCGVERERPGVRDVQRVAQPRRRRAQDLQRMVLGVCQQRLVRADDALGPARGARGEHHIGGLSGMGGDGGEVVDLLRCRGRDQGIVDDDGRAALVEDVGDTVGGHRGVQGDDHATRLEHTQHRDHILRAARKVDRDRTSARTPRATSPAANRSAASSSSR